MLYAPTDVRPVVPISNTTTAFSLDEGLTQAPSDEKFAPSVNSTEVVSTQPVNDGIYNNTESTAGSHLRQGMTTAKPSRDEPYYLV